MSKSIPLCQGIVYHAYKQDGAGSLFLDYKQERMVEAHRERAIADSQGDAHDRRGRRGHRAGFVYLYRGFVRDLAHDTEDAAIVSAIVALGQALKLQIVAEGVETTAQQAFLTGLGCDSLQGFLLGRPVPAEKFIEAIGPKLRQAGKPG